MKLSDTWRAAILAAAFEEIGDLADAMQRTEPQSGYTRRVMQIEVGDFSEAGGSPDAYIDIDLETAALLVPLLRALIAGQLHALGVEVPEAERPRGEAR